MGKTVDIRVRATMAEKRALQTAARRVKRPLGQWLVMMGLDAAALVNSPAFDARSK
jgi:hypothetical protein